jgi:hypothetical protein
MEGTREVHGRWCWVLTRRARATNRFDAMKTISTLCTERVGHSFASACVMDRELLNDHSQPLPSPRYTHAMPSPRLKDAIAPSHAARF